MREGCSEGAEEGQGPSGCCKLSWLSTVPSLSGGASVEDYAGVAGASPGVSSADRPPQGDLTGLTARGAMRG